MRTKQIEKLLVRSFDKKLGSREQKLLDEALEKSPDLMRLQQEIVLLRKRLSHRSTPSYRPFFEERVMQRISSRRPEEHDFYWWYLPLIDSFRKVAITALILLILLISYNLKNGNSYSINHLFGKSGYELENAFDPVQNLLGSGM